LLGVGVATQEQDADAVGEGQTTGRKTRILTVVDIFSSYVPVLHARHNCRGEDAVATLEAWRRHYHEDRPHSAIGYNVPNAMHYPDDAPVPTSGDNRKIPAYRGPRLRSTEEPWHRPESRNQCTLTINHPFFKISDSLWFPDLTN